MDFKSLNSVYFIGIGGIGMSGLARYFADNGVVVAGYDRTPSAVTDSLSRMGVDVIFEDNPEKLPENIDLVIYTPAVKDELNIIKALVKKGLEFVKRAEVLGWISKTMPTIAVAGTHGKTTVTSMLVHIMKSAGIRICGFVGGVTKNYLSNYVGDKNPQWMVVEADEFDRSFLNLEPYYGIITSMDADHLDIYENHHSLNEAFFQFMKKINKDGHLILKEGLPYPVNIKTPIITYNASGKGADIITGNIESKDMINNYDVDGIINVGNIELKVPGLHNIENSLAAITIAWLLGIEADIITRAVNSYEGVLRRFDIRYNNNDIIYIDDYAHHPEELKALISAVRVLLPGKRITGVFQPHLYSRTRDFADEFATSLELLDELILLDIYPARERPIDGITSNMLLKKINLKEKKILKKEQLVEFLRTKRFEVLLTLGAGDIDRMVEPLTEMIRQKTNIYTNGKENF